MDLVARAFWAVLVGVLAALVAWVVLLILPAVEPGQIPYWVGLIVGFIYLVRPYFRP